MLAPQSYLKGALCTDEQPVVPHSKEPDGRAWFRGERPAILRQDSAYARTADFVLARNTAHAVADADASDRWDGNEDTHL